MRYAAVGFLPGSDVWFDHRSYNAVNGVNESLAIGDWGIDRNRFDFKTNFTPSWALRGQLAESWERPDLTSVVFHIRQNVFWRDESPVNGRQLTAHDIAYNWNRYLGLEQLPSRRPSWGGSLESSSRSPRSRSSSLCSS